MVERDEDYGVHIEPRDHHEGHGDSTNNNIRGELSGSQDEKLESIWKMRVGRRGDSEDRKPKCFVMRKLERWLSGHKRLGCGRFFSVCKRIQLRELLLQSEELLESVRFQRRWAGRAPKPR